VLVWLDWITECEYYRVLLGYVFSRFGDLFYSARVRG
jgi:hypothetical protein